MFTEVLLTIVGFFFFEIVGSIYGSFCVFLYISPLVAPCVYEVMLAWCNCQLTVLKKAQVYRTTRSLNVVTR